PISYFLSLAPPTTATSPLSLHDALPIFTRSRTCGDHMRDTPYTPRTRRSPCLEPPTSLSRHADKLSPTAVMFRLVLLTPSLAERSEEHTSELQSQSNLVCRLLLEKKKKK